MTSEREAFEKYMRDNLPLPDDEMNQYHLDSGNLYHLWGAAWKTARQDWPSEDEAVEIMAKAMRYALNGGAWNWESMAGAAYRALLAATPAPKGGE